MTIDYMRYYQNFHSDDDRHYLKMRRYYSHLLRPALDRLDERATVLDVGCGTGLLVNALIAEGFPNTSGIDVCSSSIAIAQNRSLPCYTVSAEYLFEQANREPCSLDAVFLLDVLEHIAVDEQISFLNSVYRLIKVGGFLVVSVPNANSPVACRYRYNDWTHTCAFTEHSLDFVMASSGFDDFEFLPYSVSAPTFFPHFTQARFWTSKLRRLTRALRRLEMIGELGRQGFRIPLDVNLLAIATKR